MCQKFSLEKLFNKAQISIKSLKPFCIFCLGRATEVHPASKDEVPTEIGRSMIMTLGTRKPNFTNQWWCIFHIWFIMILCYKMRQILLQNETMRQVFNYKIQQFYCNLQQLI